MGRQTRCVALPRPAAPSAPRSPLTPVRPAARAASNPLSARAGRTRAGGARGRRSGAGGRQVGEIDARRGAPPRPAPAQAAAGAALPQLERPWLAAVEVAARHQRRHAPPRRLPRQRVRWPRRVRRLVGRRHLARREPEGSVRTSRVPRVLSAPTKARTQAAASVSPCCTFRLTRRCRGVRGHRT